MGIIHGKDLQEALEKTYRVYLCGDLRKSQEELDWIHDENNEMGMSFYQNFTADHAHYHTKATEYNFVLSGRTKIYLVDEKKEIELETGSVWVLPPMTKYASKHQPGTRILFFKSPGGNDKQLIEVTPELEAWLSCW